MMDVAVSGRGKGDLESTRLNRFVELLRRTRIGLRTPLLSDASSASGWPFSVEELLPMVTECDFDKGFFGFGRGTCVLVS